MFEYEKTEIKGFMSELSYSHLLYVTYLFLVFWGHCNVSFRVCL